MTERKTYPPEFKLEVVKSMLENGYTIQQAHDEFSVGYSALRRWKAQYQDECTGVTPLTAKAITPEHQEIQGLKQQVQQLKREKDILKKACALFTREDAALLK